MARRTGTRLVTKAELRAGGPLEDLDDPVGIAAISANKREAILANPLVGGDDEPVRIIGTLDGRVIGRLDLIAGRIEVEDEDLACFWGSALLVPPEHRKTLMGVTLILTMHRLRDVNGACGVSRAAYPVYMSLKYLDVPMPRYVAVRHTQPIMERYLGGGVRSSAPARLADGALLLQRGAHSARRRIARRGLRCAPATRFPSELDPRLRERQELAAPHRSAAWIDWLLEHSFFDDDSHRRALYLVTDREGKAAAYFMIKARRYTEPVTKWEIKNLLVGSLHDWKIFEPSAVSLQDLVFLAGGELATWDVDAVEVTVPPDEHAAVRRWGFLPAGHVHFVLWGSPKSPIARPELQDPTSWRVRPAEADYFLS